QSAGISVPVGQNPTHAVGDSQHPRINRIAAPVEAAPAQVQLVVSGVVDVDLEIHAGVDADAVRVRGGSGAAIGQHLEINATAGIDECARTSGVFRRHD